MGAVDLAFRWDMARASVADVCLSSRARHTFLPMRLYHNAGPQIVSAIRQLQDALEEKTFRFAWSPAQTSTWCRISLRACAQAGSFACGVAVYLD